MPNKRNLDIATIVAAAAELVDQTSFEALTLNSLAARLNVKPPSLYNHVGGIDDVRRRLADVVATRMSHAIEAAAVGRSGDEALRDLARSYRAFATTHRELYRAFLAARSFGDEASFDVVATTLKKILAAYRLAATDEDNFIRILHSALYGFVALESTGVFPVDDRIDASFDVLITSQIAVLHWLEEDR